MKLQNILIIFIIISLPIIVLFSYHTHLQKQTIKTQTVYDSKLIQATKEAMEAFEINTVEWNADWVDYAGSKRRDILATTNSFISSFSNALNITGSSQKNILTYLPAIMYNLYDGYYIYAPTSVPKIAVDGNGIAKFNDEEKLLYIDENGVETADVGEAKKEYKHILKPFMPYSEFIKNKDVVINYTLDNFVKIYCEPESDSTDSRSKEGKGEGYLVNFEDVSIKKNKIPFIEQNSSPKYYMQPEILAENVMFLSDDRKKCNYWRI